MSFFSIVKGVLAPWLGLSSIRDEHLFLRALATSELSNLIYDRYIPTGKPLYIPLLGESSGKGVVLDNFPENVEHEHVLTVNVVNFSSQGSNAISIAPQWMLCEAEADNIPKFIALVFRGTDSTSDGLTNAVFFPCSSSSEHHSDSDPDMSSHPQNSFLPKGVEAHSGFSKALLACRDAVERALIIEDSHQPDLPWIVCGHSLGGAMALLAPSIIGGDILPQAEIFTFGAPLVYAAGNGLPSAATDEVGDSSVGRKMGDFPGLPFDTKLAHCFVNYNDIVPRLLGAGKTGEWLMSSVFNAANRKSRIANTIASAVARFEPVGRFYLIHDPIPVVSPYGIWEADSALDALNIILKSPSILRIGKWIDNHKVVDYCNAFRRASFEL